MAEKVPHSLCSEMEAIFEKVTTKRKLDAAGSKTRINTGVAFERWRQVRGQKGLKGDAMVAVYLLDR
uniref:Uncharacterized protein n=1 Tax=Monopterus albus TaxID=43700 RepID=A0A3Q3JEP6_MONAL